MVLAEILLKWRRNLKIEMVIAHVHHGSDGCNAEFRDHAQLFVRQWCRSRRVRYLSIKPKARGLKSESELRRFREHTLERWRRKYSFDVIVLAHHGDDLLETRLLRLIRGAGPQGLRSMSLYNFKSKKLRPLLELSRSDLETYAKARSWRAGLNWLEDPTNQETEALRNWIRHEWLPSLEARQKGASKALARSLEVLCPSEALGQAVNPENYVGLRRSGLLDTSSVQQQSVVAAFLKSLGVKDYGRVHVLEILKRLRSKRRDEKDFTMLGFCFHITPDLLWASRV